MKKTQHGKCSICGNEGKLSYEHVPPSSAFNNQTVLEADIDQILDSGDLRARFDTRRTKNQKGAGGYTLCISCNNLTGKRYGPSYVHFAKTAMPHLSKMPLGYSRCLNFNINPLRVLKQVATMFCSVAGPSLCEQHPLLRRYILNPEQRGLAETGITFWAALYSKDHSKASRQSGLSGILDASDGGSYMVSEICFQPFIFVMSLANKVPDSRLVNINHFDGYDFHERVECWLALYSLAVSSVLPTHYEN